MAVKIRLKRLGKVRVPQYRIVIVDSRKKRDGKVIEEIGKYHPKEDPSYIDVVSDRAQYWLSVGAQPTEAVEAILKVTGDWQKFKGLDGAEGTLKVKAPKRDKLEIFNEALKAGDGEAPKAAVTVKSGTAEAKAEVEAMVENLAAEEEAADVAALADAPEPRLPISGADMIARGVAAGRPVGRALRAFQALWIRAGFPKEPETLTRLLEAAVAEPDPGEAAEAGVGQRSRGENQNQSG